jgi:hypothetical protein
VGEANLLAHHRAVTRSIDLARQDDHDRRTGLDPLLGSSYQERNPFVRSRR